MNAGDPGPPKSDNAPDAGSDATAKKICRLLHSPARAEEFAADVAVEDEDADPVGPAP